MKSDSHATGLQTLLRNTLTKIEDLSSSSIGKTIQEALGKIGFTQLEKERWMKAFYTHWISSALLKTDDILPAKEKIMTLLEKEFVHSFQYFFALTVAKARAKKSFVVV